MAKVTLNNIVSGFGSQSLLDSNFDSIETELNDKVLYRDNPVGEANQMLNDLDMNSNDIINANAIATTTIIVGGIDLTDQAALAEASATDAENSAIAAGISETNASTSETNAGISEINAGTSETNAGISETNAAASAIAADVLRIEWQGSYSNVTAYVLNDAVNHLGSSFINIQAGTGNDPVIGGTSFWDDLANRGLDGFGAGDLLAINNLVDLDNVVTARTNLGVEIGTDVQAFDATILKSGDIGTSVQPFDATLEIGATKTSRKNVIINGSKAIDQRVFGAGQPATGVYGVDRWKGDVAGTRLEQVVENTRTINEPYVISWSGGTGVADVDGTTGLNSGDSFTLNTSGNYSVIVPTDAIDIQLERGSIATDFEYQHIGDTLAQCQRYAVNYENIKQFVPGNGIPRFFGGTVTWPVTMRVIPSLVLSNASYVGADTASVTTITENGTVVRAITEATTISCSFQVDVFADAEL